MTSETTLLSSLLDFLKQCQRQQTDDATVASQLQTKLSNWAGGASSSDHRKVEYNPVGKSDKHQYPQKSTVPAKEIITAVNPCEWSIAIVLTSKNTFLKQLFECGFW